MDGHAALVTALRCAPPDLSVATFLPAPSPLHFWARRQAHETAIHRADADAACGELSTYAPEFAQDGIDELLHGFAARKSMTIDAKATILLDATDGPSWLVGLGGEYISADPIDDVSEVAWPEVTLPGPTCGYRRPISTLAVEPRLAGGTQRLAGSCRPLGDDGARSVVIAVPDAQAQRQPSSGATRRKSDSRTCAQ